MSQSPNAQPQPPYGVGGPAYPPPGGPAKRSKSGPIIATIVVVVLLCCGGVIGAGVFGYQRYRDGDFSKSEPPLPDLPAEPVPTGGAEQSGSPDQDGGSGGGTVVYRVTGKGPVVISYTDGSGATKLESNDSLPWEKQITASDVGAALVVAARVGGGSESLACSLTVDGQERDTKQASGAFARVSCSSMGG